MVEGWASVEKDERSAVGVLVGAESKCTPPKIGPPGGGWPCCCCATVDVGTVEGGSKVKRKGEEGKVGPPCGGWPCCWATVDVGTVEGGGRLKVKEDEGNVGPACASEAGSAGGGSG